MHLEAHAGVGWLIGCGAPQADRGLRNWCLAAAVAPDLDAVSYVFGPQVYGRWHHVLGHNVFVGVALMALAWWHQRARGARRATLVSGLAALCFATHLLGDAKLSAYAIKLFWPFSDAEYEFTPNLGLVSPINTWLVYASFVSVVLLALWRRVTPLDVFSPRLDRIIINALSPARLHCHVCSKPSNHVCDACGEPTCLRHARVEPGFALRCSSCAAEAALPQPP